MKSLKKAYNWFMESDDNVVGIVRTLFVVLLILIAFKGFFLATTFLGL